VKNDQYFDKKAMPSIKKLVWRFIPEGTSRTIALEANEVDFIYEVETTDIKRLKTDKDVKVAEVPSVENWFLKINVDSKPFDNVNLRKAINAAIDRSAIITAALNGFGKESISCVPMGYAESTAENADAFSLEKAKAYLKAWGGNPASLTLPIICSNDLKVRIATIIQANLAEIGIKVDIVSMDFATYMDKTTKGDYVSAIQSWSPSNALTYLQRFHSRRRAGNPGSLNSPEVDALVEKAETTIDAKARTKLLQQIIGKVNSLVPQPSLYQTLIFRAYSAKLQGVVPSATGYIDFNRVSWIK
jgi:peptide/nickel transport system substrate-binding protein